MAALERRREDLSRLTAMSRSASLADTKYRHFIEPGGVDVAVADVEADQTGERPSRDLFPPGSLRCRDGDQRRRHGGALRRAGPRGLNTFGLGPQVSSSVPCQGSPARNCSITFASSAGSSIGISGPQSRTLTRAFGS